MPTRLKGLQINRVSLVPEGDNPGARITIAKSAPARTRSRKEVLADALEHGGRSGGDPGHVSTTEPHEKGDGMSDTMQKATGATATLVKLVDQEITRRPTDEKGRRVTRQMALAKVWSDPEAKQALHERDALGVDASNAVMKQFGK